MKWNADKCRERKREKRFAGRNPKCEFGGDFGGCTYGSLVLKTGLVQHTLLIGYTERATQTDELFTLFLFSCFHDLIYNLKKFP